jgi:crotonobetainyl-CoA:carnitine CoA-transferase CaiB-like acyl-CoA transferase
MSVSSAAATSGPTLAACLADLGHDVTAVDRTNIE